jgi:hypothetical protein
MFIFRFSVCFLHLIFCNEVLLPEGLKNLQSYVWILAIVLAFDLGIEVSYCLDFQQSQNTHVLLFWD